MLHSKDGASKLASEILALEYSATGGFPVWLNRCGVLAGAGQFGRADQGIFAYWINCHLRRAPLRYLGFDGQGHQVRDCLHPRDLVPLLQKQIAAGTDTNKPRVVNVSGGRASAMALRQLTEWCHTRFGPHSVASDPRPMAFDLPWVVLDASRAREVWDWSPQMARRQSWRRLRSMRSATQTGYRFRRPPADDARRDAPRRPQGMRGPNPRWSLTARHCRSG